MRGYLNEPEQTAETIDEDGWMRTGDIYVVDAAGYIDITDRKKDMFINGWVQHLSRRDRGHNA